LQVSHKFPKKSAELIGKSDFRRENAVSIHLTIAFNPVNHL